MASISSPTETDPVVGLPPLPATGNGGPYAGTPVVVGIAAGVDAASVTLGAGFPLAQPTTSPPEFGSREAASAEEARWAAFAGHDEQDAFGSAPAAATGEWNPGEEAGPAPRARHRVVKQRGSTLARGGTALGVGVIAAVGASGMATAQGRPAGIALPDALPDVGAALDHATEAASHLPHAVASLPGARELVSVGASHATTDSAATPATMAHPLSTAGARDGAGAGEALRARILQQADGQRDAADEEHQQAAQTASLHRAQADATTEREDAEKSAARDAHAETAAAHPAEPAGSYRLPVASYTLTAGFGQAGDLWSADHTGQDYAAPTGTPVTAVHAGTITSAGWAGSYGYRIVLTLDDGTQLWFCHMSSMVRTSGHVSVGEVIGRVGATGNVTGPHLHLEVRPGGDAPVDPMPWLRTHGLDV